MEGQDFNRAMLSAVEVEPHGTAVFGRHLDTCGVRVDGTYSAGYDERTFMLNNDGDSLSLFNQKTGFVVDQTPRFDASFIRAGSSVQLHPDALNHQANDRLEHWFASSSCKLANTPGAPNVACGGAGLDQFELNDTEEQALQNAYFEVYPFEVPPLDDLEIGGADRVDRYAFEVEARTGLTIELDHDDVELRVFARNGSEEYVDRTNSFQLFETQVGQAGEVFIVEAHTLLDTPTTYSVETTSYYVDEWE